MSLWGGRASPAISGDVIPFRVKGRPRIFTDAALSDAGSAQESPIRAADLPDRAEIRPRARRAELIGTGRRRIGSRRPADLRRRRDISL